MSGKRVNYDQLAPTYDRRFEESGQRGTAAALLALAQTLGAERILEVWLADLRPLTDQLHGLDLSTGMLAQARERDKRLHLIRGRAGQLPFPEAFFDLVCSVNAIHHFDRQRAFVFEARRLLRPGGALAVVGMDPHGRRDHWYAYHYFEGTFETDLARFPSWETVLDWMTAAGFERVERQLVERILDHKVGWAVLEDPFLQKEACSQLALLTDEVYTAGLSRIRAALETAEAAGQRLVFPVDILVEMLVGRAVV